MPAASDPDDQATSDQDTFEIASTLDDHAAFLRYVTRRPYRLAFQAAAYGFIWLSFFVMQLAIGLIGALFAAEHDRMAAARAYLTTGFRQDFATSAPVFTGFVALLVLLSVFVLIPRQCRTLAAKIMDGYPAPPGETTSRVLTSRLHLSERGFESASDHERVFVAWSLVRNLAETRRHLFLMTGRANGLIIPKSSLDTASSKRLCDAVTRRLANAGTR